MRASWAALAAAGMRQESARSLTDLAVVLPHGRPQPRAGVPGRGAQRGAVVDAADEQVPSGWRGVRGDFVHFCKVHGATSWGSRVHVALTSRSLWGLAVYRYGRWVYARPRSPATLPLRALYSAAFEVVRRLSKTSFAVRSRIEREVWIAPQGEVFISLGSRVGRGSMLHGANTIGLGGRGAGRGHPQLGERVVFCPGAAAVGPVEIPDGTVVGPNALAARPTGSGPWVGVPSRARPDLACSFVPAPPRVGRREHRQETAMKPEPFWPAYRADLQRHFVYHPNAGVLQKLRIALTSDGSWAMAMYRFGRRLRTLPPPSWAAPLLWGAYRAGEIALGLVTTISIDVDAEIAPGFYLGHFVSVRIGPGVKIGRNSSVGQMCTLEGAGPHPEANAPVLGERVFLGSGARVIGPLRLGDGAAICANTVVVRDVPENGVVLGNPGVLLNRRGSAEFIYLGPGTGVRDAVPGAGAALEKAEEAA